MSDFFKLLDQKAIRSSFNERIIFIIVGVLFGHYALFNFELGLNLFLIPFYIIAILLLCFLFSFPAYSDKEPEIFLKIFDITVTGFFSIAVVFSFLKQSEPSIDVFINDFQKYIEYLKLGLALIFFSLLTYFNCKFFWKYFIASYFVGVSFLILQPTIIINELLLLPFAFIILIITIPIYSFKLFSIILNDKDISLKAFKICFYVISAILLIMSVSSSLIPKKFI